MRIPRLPWDRYWMLMAHLTATRSTCDRGPTLLFDPDRHGVGAVLVKNKRAIAGGYNGSAPGQPHCDDPPGYHECDSRYGLSGDVAEMLLESGVETEALVITREELNGTPDEPSS